MRRWQAQIRLSSETGGWWEETGPDETEQAITEFIDQNREMKLREKRGTYLGSFSAEYFLGSHIKARGGCIGDLARRIGAKAS